MAVSQKIISGNPQPNGGCAVVGVAGARGLDPASFLDSKHTLNPAGVSPLNVDKSIAAIDASLDTRYDDPRYYAGDSAS
jgi:hypothetical protein